MPGGCPTFRKAVEAYCEKVDWIFLVAEEKRKSSNREWERQEKRRLTEASKPLTNDQGYREQ